MLQVQKLLFSATLTRDPSQIQTLNLKNPKYISVQDSTPNLDSHRNPIDFNQAHTLPSTLREHMLILPSALKPLHLIELLHRENSEEILAGEDQDGDVKDPLKSSLRNVLCFTKSVESARRLVGLLRNFEEIWKWNGGVDKGLEIREYSSDLGKGERKEILKDFKGGKIDM